MSILYTTGPVNLYIGVTSTISNSGTYGAGLTQLLQLYELSDMFYLGTCQQAPEIQLPSRYKELIADLNGGALPFDVMWCGQEARVTMLLSRWNEWVYRKMTALPNPMGTRGTYTAADVGTMMLHQAKAFCLWAEFPYYTKYGSSTNPTGFGAPKGYRFLANFTVNESLIVGSQSGRRLLQLQALPVYDVSDGTCKLYDDNMNKIPVIPPVTADGVITLSP